jgi:hypothetical protein
MEFPAVEHKGLRLEVVWIVDNPIEGLKIDPVDNDIRVVVLVGIALSLGVVVLRLGLDCIGAR